MKRRIILVSLSIAVAGGLAWLMIALLWNQREPSYEGRTLSKWLEIWGPIRKNLTTQDASDCANAVRHIGSNAVPFLLRMLATPDSAPAWKQRLEDLAGKQKIVTFKFAKPSDIRMRGQMGLYILGPDAKSAVPELIRMYNSGIMPEFTFAYLLGAIGPYAKPAIPKLLVTSKSATNELEQATAIQALGKIHSDASNVVPTLITYLTDKSKVVQAASAIALGEYESNAKAAVPALVKLAEQDPPTNNPSRLASGMAFLMQQPGAAAIEALSRIDHEAYENFTRSK
jgi:HEAT repeat protein